MKLYSKDEDYTLYHGSMLDMLEAIEPESIDAIVTDPPYELNFMNKGWDNSGIAFQKNTWQNCFKVLKRGGYLLAFGGTRTFHRIACAIEDAGFEIRDTIMWLYGSGFPKSMDISKQIDKKGGNDYSEQFAIDLKQARESRNLTMKYCDDKYCNGSTNWSWYEGRKDGCRVPDYNTYLEIIKEFPELEKYKNLIKEAEREIIGKKESGCFNNQEKDRYTIGSSKSLEVDITVPSTDLAKQWQGWGTALKPAYEPIIVARKPVEKTVADNVLKYGVGGINIDECRVPFNGDKWETQKSGKTSRAHQSEETTTANGVCEANDLGRFPSNVILTYDDTDFEEVCGGMPNTESSFSLPNREKSNCEVAVNIINSGAYKSGMHYGDEGSASRYFYTAKASKKDRDEGLYDAKEQQKLEYCLQYHNGEKRNVNSFRKNIHPTVKPTDLMQYLVRLVSPKGATILDPFNGSGSTGKAVMFENKERNANYKYIGIEMTEEYLPIAKARIEFVDKIDSIEKYLYESKKEILEKTGCEQISLFDVEK